jgi:hypothetical protein
MQLQTDGTDGAFLLELGATSRLNPLPPAQSRYSGNTLGANPSDGRHAAVTALPVLVSTATTQSNRSRGTTMSDDRNETHGTVATDRPKAPVEHRHLLGHLTATLLLVVLAVMAFWLLLSPEASQPLSR